MSADLMSNSRSIQGEVCSFLTLKTRHSSPWSPRQSPALLSFLTHQQVWTRGDKAPFCDPARLHCSQEWVSPWERPGPRGPCGVTQVDPCVLKAWALWTQLFLLRAFAGCPRGPGEAWAGRPVGA